MVSHKRLPWRRRHPGWFWSIVGLVGLVVAGSILSAVIGSSLIQPAAQTVSSAPPGTPPGTSVPAVVATAPRTTAAAPVQQPTTSSTGTTPAPVTTGAAAPAGEPAPAQLAQTGCETFESGIAPVIQSSVATGDLAPIIRVSVGEDPNSATSEPYNPNGPYPASVKAVAAAAEKDPTYQPVNDAFGALTTAILEVGPHRSLQPVADASSHVLATCRSAHALP